jgi:DNA uptake protein ComE-like DNA-binding protein
MPVDVTTATVDQLVAVPGLDEASAYLIVQERTHGAGFRSLADVQRLLADRIGPHEFRVLQSRLTLSRPAQTASGSPRTEGRDIG